MCRDLVRVFVRVPQVLKFDAGGLRNLIGSLNVILLDFELADFSTLLIWILRF